MRGHWLLSLKVCCVTRRSMLFLLACWEIAQGLRFVRRSSSSRRLDGSNFVRLVSLLWSRETYGIRWQVLPPTLLLFPAILKAPFVIPLSSHFYFPRFHPSHGYPQEHKVGSAKCFHCLQWLPWVNKLRILAKDPKNCLDTQLAFLWLGANSPSGLIGFVPDINTSTLCQCRGSQGHQGICLQRLESNHINKVNQLTLALSLNISLSFLWFASIN